MMSVIGAVAYSLSVISTLDGANRFVTAFPDDSTRPPRTTGDAESPENVLVIGSDVRGALNGNINEKAPVQLDTTMMVHIAGDRGSVQVLFLRRDLVFDLPDGREMKLAAAYKSGGVPLIVSAVEKFVGVRIDHVAMVDFRMVGEVTDALGGVTVSNPRAFDPVAPPGLHFPEGPNTLDGSSALAFIREVKAFKGGGDDERLLNQELYLKSVLERTLTERALLNPITLSRVMRAVADGTTMDKGLSARYLLGIAFELRDLTLDQVGFLDVPTLARKWTGTEWAVRPRMNEVTKLQTAFADDDFAGLSPSTVP